MPQRVWLLKLVAFAVLMEADLGRRKIGRFRVLRPLITIAVIVPLFITVGTGPTTGRAARKLTRQNGSRPGSRPSHTWRHAAR
jgi:hypothetical protein